MESLGHSHIVRTSSIAFTKFIERKLSHILGLFLAWNRSALSNLHALELADAIIRKLVPHVFNLLRSVIVVMLTWIVVAVQAHSVQETVVDGAQIDDVKVLIYIINKWQEECSLQAIQIEVFGWTIG